MRTLTLCAASIAFLGCGGKSSGAANGTPGGTTETSETDTGGIDSAVIDTGPIDADGDGYPASEDCDDDDSQVHPGAGERCDGKDDDCNGTIDDDASDATSWYPDTDGDGHGDPSSSVTACDPPSGYVSDDTDCDDSDANTNPAADEVCGDGIDQDCSGVADDGCRKSGETSLADAHAVLSGAPNDFAGVDVAFVGDLDGDGADEVAVGAQGHGGTGAAFVLAGPVTASGDLASLATATIAGSSVYDAIGSVVAPAGDVDGDGLDDLLLASPDYPGAREEGGVWLFYGPLSGSMSVADADASFSSAIETTDLGRAAATGDVDGDGILDLVAGASGPTWEVTTPGEVAVFLGPVSGAVTMDYALILGGEADGDLAGWALGVADLDGDGLAEVAVGAPSANDSGRVYVTTGPITGDGALGDGEAVLDGANKGDGAGTALSAGGDVDGDGYGDLLVGAPGAATAYLVLGPVTDSGALDSLAAAVLSGPASDDQAGAAVDLGGDVDADGHADLLIGGPQESTAAGIAWLQYGPVSGTVDLGAADASFTGPAATDRAGIAVSVSGDTDADGYADLLVGGDGVDVTAGAAWLIRGALP